MLVVLAANMAEVRTIVESDPYWDGKVVCSPVLPFFCYPLHLPCSNIIATLSLFFIIRRIDLSSSLFSVFTIADPSLYRDVLDI